MVLYKAEWVPNLVGQLFQWRAPFSHGSCYNSQLSFHSAAKAPFLAKFRVAKCGTAEVETINTQEEHGTPPLHSGHEYCAHLGVQ